MTPEQIIKKYEDLKGSRAVWEDHWQEVADFVLPEKNDVNRTTTEGQKKGATLYDATAQQSLELLAGALHGMLTNPSSTWFELGTGDPKIDEIDSVRKWFQQAAQVMHDSMNNSNFQTEIHEVYIDLGGFGTVGLDILEDPLRDIRFAARMISEFVVEESNLGVIDSLYRAFDWTARQIVQEFGLDVCPKRVQDAFDKNEATKFTIIHAIYPRDLSGLSDNQKKFPKGYPVGSKYILKEDKVELEEQGFEEFPTAVPRWMKTSRETYGRSPAMKALPDIKMLNEIKKTVIRSAQKTIDPPLQGPDEGFINKVNLTSGAMNYYRAGSTDRIEPIITNARVDIADQLIADTKQAIQQAFYCDQFQMQQGPQMTATEVQQRTEEKMRLLAPMLGRQHSELLAPMIQRVFRILARKKRFPPMPAELQGKEYKVRYCSLIARAQKSAETQNVVRTMEDISPLAQMNPEVMDNFDHDKIARWAAQNRGLPQELLRDQAEMKKLRAGRQAARQQMNQQMMEQHQAELTQKTLPALARGKEAGVV